MTDKRLSELNKINEGIKRLEDMLYAMERTWNRGKIFTKQKTFFQTEYGIVKRTAELEPDEYTALKTIFLAKLLCLKEQRENAEDENNSKIQKDGSF